MAPLLRHYLPRRSLPHVTHLLVVDDHRSIRDPLAAYLRRQGFEVTTASDGVETRARLLEQRFDLVVLDRMLPGEDGLSLCRHIGQAFGTPVILLTAKAEHADRITGLDQGADDYVTKPFSVDELMARIRSVLRRTGGQVASTRGVESGRLRFADWSLDLLHRQLHAFSLVIPMAICFQNCRSASRRSESALGERMTARPVDFCIRPVCLPITPP